MKLREKRQKRKYLLMEDVKSIRVDYKTPFHNYVSRNDCSYVYNWWFLPWVTIVCFQCWKYLWRPHVETVVMQRLNNAGQWHRLTGNKISRTTLRQIRRLWLGLRGKQWYSSAVTCEQFLLQLKLRTQNINVLEVIFWQTLVWGIILVLIGKRDGRNKLQQMGMGD
jgi:hypothetical protein